MEILGSVVRAQSRGREDRRGVCRKADGEGHGEDWGLHPSVGKEEKGAALGCILHTNTRGCILHTRACAHTHHSQSSLGCLAEMQLLHTAGVVFHLGHLSLRLQMGLII